MRNAGRNGMRRAGAVVGTGLLLLACGPEGGQEEAAPRHQDRVTVAEGDAVVGNSFAIVNVRVFDGGNVIENAMLSVEDGRVALVDTAAAPPEGVPVIEGAGMTVLPGFIDAHTHTFVSQQLMDALRFGVTAELDMLTSPAFLNAERAQRDSLGRTDKADLYSAGLAATSEGGHGTQYGLPIPTLSGPEDAEDFVAGRVAQGSDYIKIIYEPGSAMFTSIDRPTMGAVIDAARAAGKMAVVHVSTQAAAKDAVEMGADGLVHVFGDSAVEDSLANAMSAQGVFVVPTLSVIRGIDKGDLAGRLLSDPALGPQISPNQQANLTQSFNLQAMPEDRRAAFEGIYNSGRAADNVRALHEAGVYILAGSDAPNPGTAHGVSIHGELALLVEAGLSPEEALEAATSKPAGAFGLEDRGTLEPGARADLLLVKGNPLEDITATRRIARVFKNGFEVAREAPEAPEPAEGGAAPALEGGWIARMDDEAAGLGTALGAGWAITTDALAGGQSTADMARVTPGAGGAGGALEITGEIKAGAPFPWSGAGVFFGSPAGGAQDWSGYEGFSFAIKGTPGTYLAMLFTRTSAQQPAFVQVPVSGDWGRVDLSLNGFANASLDEVYGFAVTKTAPAESFTFALDDVRLTSAE